MSLNTISSYLVRTRVQCTGTVLPVGGISISRSIPADCSRFDSRPYHYFLSVELTSKNVHVVCKNVIVSSASLCCSVGVQYGTKGIFDVINVYFTMM
jgi:hypothetical protein